MSFCRVTRLEHLPLSQAEAPGQCEGFLGSLVFRKSCSFKLKTSTSQALLSFPWKLLSSQASFFAIWACTCTALVAVPGGLVVSDSSLDTISGFSFRPGGTCHGCPWCYWAGLCVSLCPSAFQGKGSSPEAPGSPGHSPSKERVLARSSPPRQEGKGQVPSLTHSPGVKVTSHFIRLFFFPFSHPVVTAAMDKMG